MKAPPELQFSNVTGIYNSLWRFGEMLSSDAKFPKPADYWLSTYKHGLRGLAGRLTAVDRVYTELRKFRDGEAASGRNPNEWAIDCDSHVALLFFGMDSAFECFVFSMNALGALLSPVDFCDITQAKALSQIKPGNIPSGNSATSKVTKAGYQKFFPQVVAFWQANSDLIAKITDLHDVSKHRSAVVTGGSSEETYIQGNPKQPGTISSDVQNPVEAIALRFQKFIDELLVIAMKEAAFAFDYVVDEPSTKDG